MGVQRREQHMQHIQPLTSNRDEFQYKHSECCMYFFKALGLWSYAINTFLPP